MAENYRVYMKKADGSMRDERRFVIVDDARAYYADLCKRRTKYPASAKLVHRARSLRDYRLDADWPDDARETVFEDDPRGGYRGGGRIADEPTVQKTIRFPESLLEELEAEAQQAGIAFAPHVIQICRNRQSTGG